MTTILLDVGGTLWPDRWPFTLGDAETRAVRLAGMVPGFTAELWTPLQEALSRAERTAGASVDSATALAAALREVGAEADGVSPEALRRAMCLPAYGTVDLFAGAGELLGTIKELRLACVVITNAVWRDGTCYRRDFEDFGISEYIDAVVSSVDVGRRKPDPALFTAAVAAARCDAGSCVMIGNSEEKDIAPALAMGMRAIRVAIEEPRPGSSCAHAVAGSLWDAACVLTEMVRAASESTP